MKLWHPEHGYVKFYRHLPVSLGYAHVEVRGAKELQKVKTDDLLLERPPKLTKEERDYKRFLGRLNIIKVSQEAYRMAGWLASHETRFNISRPPSQVDILPDILIQYNIEIDDAAVTLSSDATQGWSCHVSSERMPDVKVFENETKIVISDYFSDSTRMQAQVREFVMGFLGDMLGFRFNANWLNRAKDTLPEFLKIRSRVPMEFLESFDKGCHCAGYNNA